MFEFYEELKNQLLDDIVNKTTNDINKKSLGFIDNSHNCNLNIMCIIFHALENHEILNNIQQNNIINIYNDIKYVK